MASAGLVFAVTPAAAAEAPGDPGLAATPAAGAAPARVGPGVPRSAAKKAKPAGPSKAAKPPKRTAPTDARPDVAATTAEGAPGADGAEETQGSDGADPRAAKGAPKGTVVPPRLLEHTHAAYPQGVTVPEPVHVVLLVTVGVDGLAKEVTIAQSGGPPFDESAKEAVKTWRFAPATRDGTPVASRIRVPFHFEPPRSEAPAAAAAGDAGTAVASPETTPARVGVTKLDPASVPPELEVAAHDEEPEPLHEGGGVESVRVRGRAVPPSRGASDFHLPVGELARVPRMTAAELLKLAPGILLTNEGGEGHANQVFMRGFDAREGQDIEFSVGGVPINEAGNLHANGYADTHFILPEVVESLRVLEGPYDPRQGNFAVAGSVEYSLGLQKRGLIAKGMAGSFDTQRLVLLWGPEGTSHHTFGGVELYKTAGYGQNRDARRGSGMAQYEGSLGSFGTFRVLAQGYAADYHSAGLLRDDDYRAGRKGFFDTYDPTQGGQSTRFSLAFDVEGRVGKTNLYFLTYLVSRSMRVQENFTGFLLDVQEPTQTPHKQRGDLIDRSVGSFTVGSRGHARARLGRTWSPEAEIGYFARYDESDGVQLRVENATQVPYKRDVDLLARTADIGLHADAHLRPLPWVSLRGGVRADLFTFHNRDRCASRDVRRPDPANPPGDASCLSQQDFGRYREPDQTVTASSIAVMPRTTLALGPWAGVLFSAAYGEGVRSIDPIYVEQGLKTPFAHVRSYEAGASYSTMLGSVELVARSVFFETKVDKDLVFSQTEGRNTLANGTTRTGWVGAVRATGKFFDENANVTLVRSSFDDTGLLLPYVPDVVVRSDTAFFTDLPLRFDGSAVRGTAGLGLSYVGRRALPYGQRSDDIFTVDASLGVAFRFVELSVMATNLFDNRYRLGEYNFASDWGSAGARPTLVPVRHFAAGAPRGVFATLTFTFGGAS